MLESELHFQQQAFKAMQMAVDIVGTSEHPKSKVAASIFSGDQIITSTNFWPKPIKEKLGLNTRIGDSSATIHAETGALLKAHSTKDAAICITDPFCPNCAKNIAEAGIKHVFIDHKGFDKAFWSENKGAFENLSMAIIARAGITVYEIHRKEKRIEILYTPPSTYAPNDDCPIIYTPVKTLDKTQFIAHAKTQMTLHADKKFTLGAIHSAQGQIFLLTALQHIVTGLSEDENKDDIKLLSRKSKKYTLIEEPVNRFLMYTRKKDYSVEKPYFFCSQIPTSREQVNMLGAGFSQIYIGDMNKARDKSSQKAKAQLSNAGLLEFIAV